MQNIVNDYTLGMYAAALVSLVVTLGFLIYLWRIDRRVRDLDRTLRQQANEVRLPDTARVEVRPKPIEKEVHDGVDRR
jgi:uncharacterized membrane protein YhiD involved in acid resistance